MRDELLARAAAEAREPAVSTRPDVALCFGTFLSRHSYNPAIQEFGLVDARNA
jgi:hypothetical protein